VPQYERPLPVGILSDDQLCSLREQHPIIEPFVARQIRQLAAADAPFRHRSVISYGLSSHGYDVRLSDEGLRVFVQQEHKWASDFDGHGLSAGLAV
jgi:deoxycytidine triphosphate deaminase